MKILHCLDTLAVGGAERVGIDACNLLAETDDYLVELLLIRHGGPLRKALNPTVLVKELGFYRKTSFKGWIQLIKALRGFDVIHVHMRHTYGRVKLAALISGLGTKIIFHDHFGDIEHNKAVPSYLQGRFRPSYYIGVSKDLSDWARERLVLMPENSWTLPNTIARQISDNVKDRHSKDLVLVSNLRETKNIEFAIQLAKSTCLELDIYGQVINEDYYRQLRKIAAGYPIYFKTDVSDVFPYLPQYKLAIHTAKSETGPLVAMEYLKSGTNFISFNTGEVIRQIKTELPHNILYDFEAENWIMTIKAAMLDPISERQLTEVFERLFGSEAYLNKLKEIYRWVAAN
ncbi:glycosyltransferase [Schleiferiaceae bacterium]|nr:glycosyltransferase [Schleiferiaceae bacterium]